MSNDQETMPDDIKLLTVGDLAELLKTTPNCIYQMRNRGQLPEAIKIGKRIYWRADVVRDWLANLPAS